MNHAGNYVNAVKYISLIYVIYLSANYFIIKMTELSSTRDCKKISATCCTPTSCTPCSNTASVRLSNKTSTELFYAISDLSLTIPGMYFITLPSNTCDACFTTPFPLNTTLSIIVSPIAADAIFGSGTNINIDPCSNGVVVATCVDFTVSTVKLTFVCDKSTKCDKNSTLFIVNSTGATQTFLINTDKGIGIGGFILAGQQLFLTLGGEVKALTFRVISGLSLSTRPFTLTYPFANINLLLVSGTVTTNFFCDCKEQKVDKCCTETSVCITNISTISTTFTLSDLAVTNSVTYAFYGTLNATLPATSPDTAVLVSIANGSGVLAFPRFILSGVKPSLVVKNDPLCPAIVIECKNNCKNECKVPKACVVNDTGEALTVSYPSAATATAFTFTATLAAGTSFCVPIITSCNATVIGFTIPGTAAPVPVTVDCRKIPSLTAILEAATLAIEESCNKLCKCC